MAQLKDLIVNGPSRFIGDVYATTFTGNLAGNASTATSATNAGTVGGLSVHSGRNNEANKIVRTDGNGFLQVGYINSSSGHEKNASSPTYVWGSNSSDSYLRSYQTSSLSVKYSTTSGSCSGNAATATNADKLDGFHESDFSRHVAGDVSSTGTTYYKLGTLPASKPTTRDAFLIQGEIGGFLSSAKAVLNVCVGRRNGVTFSGYTQGLWQGNLGVDIGVNDAGEIALIVTRSYASWTLDLHTIQGEISYTGNTFTPADTNFVLLSESNNVSKSLASGAVEKSTKLATSRTLWGQSFDGTGNVSGAISGATSITASGDVSTDGNLKIGSYSVSNPTLSIIDANYGTWKIQVKPGYMQIGYGDGPLCINGNGNVGIGTNSPSHKLHVNGTLGVADIAISSSSATPININSTGSECGIRFHLNDTAKGGIWYHPDLGTYLYTYADSTGDGKNHSLSIRKNGNGYIDTNTILHSGNIKEQLSDVNTATSWRFFHSTKNAINAPTGANVYISGVTFATDSNPDYQLQLGLDYDGKVFSRREAGGKWNDWKQLAFLDSNVASSTKATQDGDGNTITSTYLPVSSGTVNAICSTAAHLSAKEAVAKNFILTTGVNILITFTVANTYKNAMTLDVNGTGAKTLYINDAVTSTSNYTIPVGTYNCWYDGYNWYLDTGNALRVATIKTYNINATSGFCLLYGSTAANVVLQIGVSQPNTAYFYNNYSLYMARKGIAVGGFASTSDMTMKDRIEDLRLNFDDVASMPVFKFRWKDSEAHGDNINVGTSAQYWVSKEPLLVDGTEGSYSIQYGVLALACVKTTAEKVKELEDKVLELQEEIKTLKAL